MDDSSEIVDNFASILAQRSDKNVLNVYQGINRTAQLSDGALSANAVITKVAKQILALQGPQNVKTNKKLKSEAKKLNKSSFITVNMLHDQISPPQVPQQIKTELTNDQGGVDDNIEHLPTCFGVTQEFETSFQQDDLKDLPADNNENFHIIDISLKEPDINKLLNSPNTKQNNASLKNQAINIDTQFDDCTQILNECIEIENIDQIDMFIDDTETEKVIYSQNCNKEPLSPVFSVKSKKRQSYPSSPLIFNLEHFEKFEKIAQPVLEMTTDTHKAKQLINSQIIDNELFIQTEFKPYFENTDQTSPIIEISKDDFRIDRHLLSVIDNKVNHKIKNEDTEVIQGDVKIKEEDSKTVSQNRNIEIEDEILFSSDEEIDYSPKSLKDLPFTCALETSFYDESDVLDTTMYVNFQTASNNCILVKTDSFSKAKSLFDDVNESLTKHEAITDLVEIHDKIAAETKMESKNKTDTEIENRNNQPNDITELKSESFVINTETFDNLVFEAHQKDLNTVYSKNASTINDCKSSKIISDCLIDKAKEENHSHNMSTAQTSRFLSDEHTRHLSEKDFKETQNLDDAVMHEFQKEMTHVEDNFVHNIDSQIENNNNMNQMDHISNDTLAENKEEPMVVDSIRVDSPIGNNGNLKNFNNTPNTVLNTSSAEITDSNLFSKSNQNILNKPEMICFNRDVNNIGFTTASNKKINISEKALSKAKSVFEDINNITNNINTEEINRHEDVKQMCKKSSSGFRKTANKEIIITDKAFPEANSIFKDIHSSDIQPVAMTEITAKNEHAAITDEADHHLISTFSGLEKNILSNERSKEEAEPPLHGFKQSDEEILLLRELFEKSQIIFEKFGNYNNDKYPSEDIINKLDLKTKTISDLDKLDAECHNFIGFRTASNKEVTISAKALEKGRKLFQDVRKSDGLDVIPKICSTTQKFKGFHTASNKQIKISQKALARTKKIFENINIEEVDEYTDDKQVISENKNVNLTDVSTASQNKGFSKGTASSIKVKIPNETLERSNKLFQDINFDEGVEIESSNRNSKNKFEGFRTASNKQVKISKIALEKSRNIFEDIIWEQHDRTDQDKRVSETEYKAFQTSTDKKIEISKVALENSRKLFQDVRDNAPENFLGFQTASKKQVTISDEALEKSRKIFQNINDEIIENKSPKIEGFQTASKKTVNISKAALEKSRKLFQDIQDQEVNAESLSSIMVPSFKGFQTASNKEVKISANALERTKKIFQNIYDENINKPPPKTVDDTLKGFQTVNNKKADISEDLEKSQKLFQDAENDRSAALPYTKSFTPNFKGFQTVSNKEVKISEKALERSRKLFQELDTDEIKKPTNTIIDSICFTGFQTASNKDVKVSKAALEKSKKIFQELDDNKTNSKTELENIDVTPKSPNIKDTPFIRQTVVQHEMAKINLNKPNNNQNFGFRTGNNNKISVSKESLMKSKEMFTNLEKNEKRTIDTEDTAHKDNEQFEINIAVMNDFETTFKDSTPKTNKRSGSPILSCPKAKKRKVFKIPYSQKTKPEIYITDDLERETNPNEANNNTIDYSINYKKIKMYTLKDLQRLEAVSNTDANIDPYILKFNFENFLNFVFFGDRNDVTDTKLSIAELKNIFSNSVNKKLIPDGWLDIQLKLIIWKLISYEIKFPKTMQHTLTAKTVLDQLKFRYDKELYDAKRPILRKIMEKDDVSTRSLVLCVVAIVSGEDASASQELLLTDGWYTIKAVPDRMLSKLLAKGKIKVGTKLFTHGAELVGSEQAVSPWEDTSSIRLKVYGNSTRRARWDARLGVHGKAAMLSRLSHVAVEGGRVPKLRVLVTRVYPPLFVDKFEDGSTVTRSERLEHLYQFKYESERQAILDKIYEEVQREIDQKIFSSMGSCRKRKKQETESQIAKVTKRDGNMQFQSQLTTSQKERVEEYNNRKRERILSAIQEKVETKMAAYGLNVNRNVVTVLKVQVVDVEEKMDSCSVTKAMLSIWRPSEAITEVIKENSWLEILNVTPTAFRYSELQLSAGRQTIFYPSKFEESENMKPYTLSLKRKCYPIEDLVKNPTMATDYNEIDTVGIVIQTEPPMKEFDANKQPFQNVYLADIEKNIISINFWGGLKKFGFDNCLDAGEIVAGINLQKRAGNTKKSIPHYRVTEFTYFTKTPKNELARKLVGNLREKLTKINNNSFIEEVINSKDSFPIKMQGCENFSPYSFPNMNSSKHNAFLKTPINQNIKDDNLNLTGLDFESTFKQQDTQDLSPKTLLRKQQVKQKIAKLKIYGEPPALSPIQIINKSKKAAMAYKSPLISKSDVSSNVVNNERNLPNQEKDVEKANIECSPVICLNRTYVKRCEPKPVKLNFSKNDESCGGGADDFAEEFDCSPPLSLD